MWLGKNKEKRKREERGRRGKRSSGALTGGESRVTLDKPARSALWGTTTLIGKQKK